MGCTASKAEAGAEVVVAASVVPHFASAKAPSEDGSEPKSTLVFTRQAESVATGSSAATSPFSSGGTVMLCETRDFDIEREREGAVKSLGVVDTPVDDPRFNAITKLMSSIFQTPVALITLITEDRVWFKSKVGPFGACVTREGSWCNYISVPTSPEVLITEDASEDARFACNPYVAGAPFIKFYAGAPLVGRNGMRYGTLCIVDLKRRAFSAEMYALLVNFANLVVQELERDAASMREVASEAAVVATGQQRLEKLLASMHSSVALVDVRTRDWPVLYANAAFARDEGGDSVEACTGAGFWDLFELPERAKAEMRSIDTAVAEGRSVRCLVVSKFNGRRLSVVLRPGSSDQLAPGKGIGIPNWVPSEKALDVGCHAGALPGALEANGGAVFEGPAGTETSPTPELASCFWFVTIEGGQLGSASSTASTIRAPHTPELSGVLADMPTRKRSAKVPDSPHTFSSQRVPSQLEGLEMGPMIGSGSFGRVYRGVWRDRVVAVKLLDCTFSSGDGSASAAELAVREAELSKAMDHPCLVKTLDYAMLADSELATGGTLWMVQHMCNHGTLIEAADRGWLRKRRSLTAPPSMRAVLLTLREVAEGMAFLHSKDVVHCDLTGNNVLLESVEKTDGDERGFKARVGDFGLARVAAGAISTATFGTCSHMAPELMTEGLLTKAADVWSFGVICWEIYNGVRAFVGHRMPNVVYLVTTGRGRLDLPLGAPAGFRAMMEACLNRDHAQRPSFEELVGTIDSLLAANLDVKVAPPPPPHSLGPCKASADMAAAAARVAAQA